MRLRSLGMKGNEIMFLSGNWRRSTACHFGLHTISVEVAVVDTGTQCSGGSKREDFEEVLLNSSGDQGLTDFGDRLTVRPVVDDLLSLLGVHVLPEQEWEDGLRGV